METRGLKLGRCAKCKRAPRAFKKIKGFKVQG